MPPPRRPPPKVPPPGNGDAIERSVGRGRPVRTSRRVESAPKKPSQLPKIAAALVVFIVLLVSFWLLSNRKPRPDYDPSPGSEASMFGEAKALIRQGKFGEAKLKLKEIREENEDFEPKQIENHLKVVEYELPNEARFATGADALGKNELARASAALAQVKTNLQDRALTDAKQKLTERIEARRAEARTFLSTAKWEPLLALSDDLLLALPGDREASEWKQQAEQGIARGKRGVTKVVTAETPWLESQQRFRSGDVTGALSLAENCAKKYAQCRAIKAGLEELEAKSRKLDSLGDSELLALFELDKKLAGDVSSELSKPVRTRVAARFFLKASQAKTTGNWAKAIEAARVVLSAEPTDVKAAALISEARGITGDLYLRAYQLRLTDPPEAVKLFKEVVAMTTPDDQNHVKAKGFIERLEAR